MSDPSFSRREFLGVATAGVGALLSACNEGPPTQQIDDMTIVARPVTPTTTASPGLTPLGLDPNVDGLLYVPAGYDAATPTPLLVLLHGPGGRASEWFLDPMKNLYDELGLIVLAPEARAFSWDMPMTGLYHRDVEFIDAAMAHTFSRCNVDPGAICLGGFSDGASEALGVGIANGDFITDVIAFSPAKLFGPYRRGAPAFFVSAGTDDAIVPIVRVRDAMVPTLAAAYESVTFVEFSGGHELPDTIFRQGLEWFTA